MRAGYVYHARTHSNERFCKIGMTSGRFARDRIEELNINRYAGFSDWYVLDAIVVGDPLNVEATLHEVFRDRKVVVGPEQELFLVSREEVEIAFERYRTVPMEKYLELEADEAALQVTVSELRQAISALKETMQRMKESHLAELREEHKKQSQLIAAHERELHASKSEIQRLYGIIYEGVGKPEASLKQAKKRTRFDSEP